VPDGALPVNPVAAPIWRHYQNYRRANGTVSRASSVGNGEHDASAGTHVGHKALMPQCSGRRRRIGGYFESSLG
jgi:hypothetical protein